ncbi:MAG TPA: preprotein translocase subunit YajC [Acidimicrobiia bacterium]|jgi:preprotein translocase subunit YajC
MAIIVLYLALLAVAFFILIVRPQRRQMAARRALIASLEVGDEVITAGGIYGTILEMSDISLEVEVAPGIVLTVAREAVSSRPAPPADAVRDAAPDVPALRSDDEEADPIAPGERPDEDG